MGKKIGKGTTKHTVYYDGSCPMCSSIVYKLADSPGQKQFEAKDITKSELPEGISKERAEKEIHLVAPDGKTLKGAGAVLAMFADMPRWKFLAKLGRLPGIKQLSDVIYRMVAANRHFMFGPGSGVFWLKVIVAGGMSAGLILSVNLWTGHRVFPRVPVFDWLPVLPPALETVFFAALLVLLALIIASPNPRKYIFGILAMSTVYVLSDQMRLQPWFYQYLFMLAALAVFSWDYKDKPGRRKLLDVSRLIIAGVYLFSGMQKLNDDFTDSIFPWMIEPVARLLPTVLGDAVSSMGILIPFVEIGIGTGLLINRYRKYAIFTALLMHTSILFVIGPLGHSWNSVVWPWNLAMMLFVVTLFLDTEKFSFKNILWIEDFPFQKIALMFFWILPAFGVFGLWDSYLSAALYSGNTDRAQMYISDSARDSLPAGIRGYAAENTSSGGNELHFVSWSFDELNVPVYPENRVYAAIFDSVCEYTEDDKALLVINEKQSILSTRDKSKYNCADV